VEEEAVPLSLVQRVAVRFAAERIAYSAVVLDEASHRALLAWWPEATNTPLLAKHFAHHMTIQLGPKQADLEALPLGEKVKLKVVGWAADEKGQAVAVDCSVKSTRAHPHITVACSTTGKPMYSNELLSKGVTRVSGPTLIGTVEAVRS
jgi:hypothetical protein